MRTYDLVAPRANKPGSSEDQNACRHDRPGEAYAHFLTLRGIPVFEAYGVLWGRNRGHYFQSLPLNMGIEPNAEELRRVLRMARFQCIRYPSLNSQGAPSGLYVCFPSRHRLELLARRDRAYIRQGMQRFDMRSVDLDELLLEGILLNRETMQRQKRWDPEFGDSKGWKRFVTALSNSHGFEVTGAYLNGRLSTYMVSYREGRVLHLLYKMSKTADLVNRSNYALDYHMILKAKSEIVDYLVNGMVVANPMRSHYDTGKDPYAGFDQYKRHLGYTIIPHNLSTHFYGAVSSILASKVAYGLAKKACRVFHEDRRILFAARLINGAYVTRKNAPPIN